MRLFDLPWLCPPPNDFRLTCRRLAKQEGEVAGGLRELADYGLDADQLLSLARVVEAKRSQPGTMSGLEPFRLGLVGTAATDFLVPAIVASGLRHGLLIEVVAAGYGQLAQIAHGASIPLYDARPDAMLFMLDRLNLGLEGPDGVASALALIGAARDSVARTLGIPAIVTTVAAPLETLLGNLDCRLEATPRGAVAAFNRGLLLSLEQSPDMVLDLAGLAAMVGGESWFDPVRWHLAKMPFSHDALPLVAENAARLVAALRGKSRKVLVLDLDNTLWGGVIGDDGLTGIRLGQGDPAGEAFLAIQKYALDLHRNGVVLAVCSKNDDHIARQAFREHPDMLLREEHIAVFQANWENKPANLRAIAERLRLGIDSLVFLDDNPAERHAVRRELPQVAVPEVPDDPSFFPLIVASAGYFEAVTRSVEDDLRNRFYQADSQRQSLLDNATDMDGYLRSLEMEISMAPFDGVGRARVAQLINKSNQFNLTTRRYSEAEVAAMEGDDSISTLQVRLRDRFSDNGMISVVICRKMPDVWAIDTWLMSCRVLGRRVEEAVLAELVRRAAAEGARAVVGTYISSAKNALVRDHYRKLGFLPVGESAEGTEWRLDVSAYRQPDLSLFTVAGVAS
jgi:FkbH-like protein